MSETVKLAEYLFRRLRQLGVQSIHGVPGDFNLTLLDYVEREDLHWVGNCNELNAGYAADAYARVKGLGALITTFGVGELSAVNAVAGAYSELAPLVHIVGTPPRERQEARALIHHTLNNGDFGLFAKMHAHVTVAQANLIDQRTVPELIDAAIQQCLMHSRPVYIQVPVDMVDAPVLAHRLNTKIEIPFAAPSREEDTVLAMIIDRMYASQRPMILVDGESRAYRILDEVDQLVKSTQWPTWTSTFGKGCVDEALANVHGVWKGSFAGKQDADYIKSSDLILCLGPHFSGTNTYSYSSIPDQSASILFKQASIVIEGKTYRDISTKDFLAKLLQSLELSKLNKAAGPPTMNGAQTAANKREPGGRITQDDFYQEINSFLRAGDIILGETGTAGFGCRDFKLSPHARVFLPSTWLSIGYMLPAAQGAALAQRELHAAGKWNQDGALHHPRTILFIGDGSLQMTVQELGTIIREKLNMIVILINNDGYTIERCIHGVAEKYNDVASWRYLQAPSFLGASESKGTDYYSQTYRVETWKDLEEMLKEEDKIDSPRLCMAEVMMEREDAPEVLADMLARQKSRANDET